MVDNFEQISKLLKFDSKDIFYYIQIWKRRKDNPGMAKDVVVIQNFYVDNMDYFNKLEVTIKEVCDLNNARAYIRLNRRNYQKVAMLANFKMAELIKNENYRPIKGVYDSACGTYCGEKPKWWHIDVDSDNTGIVDPSTVSEITDLIMRVQKTRGTLATEPLTLPSVNGYHLITRPFDLLLFLEKYRERCGKSVDVHKDNPVLLYSK